MSIRKKSIFQLINGTHVLILFLVVVFGFILTLVRYLYSQVDVPEDQVYEVLPGANAREIAYDLANQEIISNPWLFNLYVSLKDLDTELQAGRYQFPKADMNVRELVRFLTSGVKAEEVEFTIPEGFTIKQIAEELVQKGLTPDLPTLIEPLYAPEFRNQYSFLPEESAFDGYPYPEGYFFPDTYRAFEDARVEDILKKILNNFARKVSPSLRQEITRQDKTLEEILIMASILEKEVQTREDMKMASDILWRRLAINMALQVDSTLNYVLADDERRAALTFDQLEIDSPYNTYKYPGLPPSAIANPGLQAIEAAIFPLENEYWFYLSTPEGETIFSTTFEEHIINKQKYLQRL